MVDELKKFYNLLKEFDSGILVTHAGNDRLHGRPMVVAQVDDNCDLWFISADDTPKTREIRQDDHVLVTFQDGGDRFVQVTGRAELLRDPQKLDEVWRDIFKAWFPQGKEDPNLMLIHVRSQEGEYWDSREDKVTFTLETLRAMVTGQTPNVTDAERHGRLQV